MRILRDFGLGSLVFVLLLLFMAKPAAASQIKNCIGLNYEQVVGLNNIQVPTLSVSSPDSEIASRHLSVEPGQIVTLLAKAVVDEAKGAKPFYYWCSDQGSFSYDNEPDYSQVKFTVPEDYNSKQINISIKVGDSLGYIKKEELLLTINDNGEGPSNPPEDNGSGVPNLIFPSHTSSNLSLVFNFDWTDVSDASEYRIQVSKSPNFQASADGKSCANCVLNGISSSSLYSLEENLSNTDELKEFLANGVKYYWRVRAANASQGASDWSQVFNFSTKDVLTETDCEHQCLKVALPKYPGTEAGLSVVQIERFVELSWEAISSFAAVVNVELSLVKTLEDGSSEESIWAQNLTAQGTYSYGPVFGDDISSNAKIKAVATLQNGQQFIGMSPSFKILAGSEEGKASIFGSIRDVDDRLIIGSKVSVQSYQGDSIPRTHSSVEGAYNIRNLAGNGTYRLTFWVDPKLNSDKYIPQDFEVELASAEQKEFNINLERRGSKGLKGTVLDANGLALTQTNIEIQSYTSGQFYRPIIEDSGAYQVDLPGGRYRSTFFIEGSEFIPQDHEFELTEGELKTIDVVLERRNQKPRPIYKSCREWFDNGYENTGYFHLDLDGAEGPSRPFEVWCDMAPFIEERDEELRIKNPPGLRFHLSFDNQDEVNSEDLSFDDGNSLNLAGIDTVQGKFANAIDLTYQELSLPYDHRHMLDTDKAITMAAWVDTNHRSTIFRQGGNYGLSISTKLIPECRYGNGAEVIANSSIIPGKWNHVACTYDGEFVKIYIDGVLSGYSKLEKEIKYTKYEDITIGSGLPHNTNEEASLKVDELRLYNDALNSKEIKALFENNQDRSFPEADQEDRDFIESLLGASYDEIEEGPVKENVDPAIVVQYKFDDKDDRQVAIDESRNSLEANVRANWDNYDSYMLYDPEGSSGSLAVKNTSAYAYVPYTSKLDIPGNQLTVGAWVQMQSNTTGLVPGSSRYGTIINKGVMNNKTAEKGHSYTLGSRTSLVRSGRYYKPQETLFCEIDTEDGRVYIPSREINGWTAVLCVYDGSKVSMYINGDFYTSRNLTGRVTNSPMPLVLGARSSNSDDPGRYDIPIHTNMKGSLDDVIILNRALEEKEIAVWNTFHRLPYPADYDSVEDVAPVEDIVSKEFENYKAPQALLNYKFDEGSGSRALDATNSLLHGAIHGASWSENNIAEVLSWNDTQGDNYALSFDGQDDYLLVPANEKINIDLNQFTVGIWAYPESQNNGGRKVLVSKGSKDHYSQGVATHSYTLGIESDGKAFCELTTTEDTAYVSSYDRLVDQLWSQIYCTYDGKDLALYINGQKQTPRRLSGSMFNSNSPLVIGAQFDKEETESNYDLYLSHHYEGKLDDFVLFNKSLSAAEIQYLFDYGEFPDPDKEVESIDFVNDSKIYLKLDEGSGNIIRDAKNRFTGTLNLPHHASHLSVSSLWNKGKINSGIHLQGSSNVVIPNSSELDSASDQLTMSIWVYPKSDKTGFSILSRSNIRDHSLPYWIFADNEGKVSCGVSTNGRTTSNGYNFGHNQSIKSTKSLKAFTWHHIACTYDGKYMRMYIDGQPTLLTWYSRGEHSDLKAPLRGTVLKPEPGVDKGLLVGHYSPHYSPYTPSYGLVDEVAIYDRALNLSQVETLYDEQNTKDPNPGELTRVIMDYNFSNGDLSGYGHGIGGRFSSGSRPGGGTTARFNVGREQNFYGYVSPADSMQVTGDSFTYSVWIQPGRPDRREGSYYVPPDRIVLQKQGTNRRTLYGMKLTGRNTSPIPTCSVNVNGIDYVARSSWSIGPAYSFRDAPWSKVTCQYDKGRLNIFVNGRQTGSAIAPNNFKDNDGYLYVAVDGWTRTNYFKGSLDDLKIIDTIVPVSSL